MKKLMVLLAFTVVSLIAADATGTWTGTLTDTTAAGDGTPGPAYLVLKQEGTKLTGTAGPNANSQRPIQNGKAEDGNLTFELVLSEGRTMKFTLKHEGDEIKGDIRGEGGGETKTAKLAVKREK
jgi:hypothetical protein